MTIEKREELARFSGFRLELESIERFIVRRLIFQIGKSWKLLFFEDGEKIRLALNEVDLTEISKQKHSLGQT